MSNQNQNAGRPSKFDAAVSSARAKDAGQPAADQEGSAAPLVPMPKGVGAMLLKPSQDDIAKLMNDETLEFAPQVHRLEEGEMITGLLEGRGPSTTFSQEDPFSKQVVTREVDTWIIAMGGVRMSILSSVQLDRKLPPCIGEVVHIFRGKEQRTNKGFRVTDYMVAVKKKTNGQPRSWVQPTVIEGEGRYIDAPTHSSAQPALGAVAGGEDHVA